MIRMHVNILVIIMISMEKYILFIIITRFRDILFNIKRNGESEWDIIG
jgi:hypothetical protein